MTDNEIIKALTEWYERGMTFCNISTSEFARNILSLIKRQQAEIERVRKYNTDVAFKHYNDGIKEFAERLKETDGYNNHIFDDCASILVSKEYVKGRDEKIKEMLITIDKLVKEMTEEQK